MIENILNLIEELDSKLPWIELEIDDDTCEFKEPYNNLTYDGFPVGSIIKMNDGFIHIVGTVNTSLTYCSCCSLNQRNITAFCNIKDVFKLQEK